MAIDEYLTNAEFLKQLPDIGRTLPNDINRVVKLRQREREVFHELCKYKPLFSSDKPIDSQRYKFIDFCRFMEYITKPDTYETGESTPEERATIKPFFRIPLEEAQKKWSYLLKDHFKKHYQILSKNSSPGGKISTRCDKFLDKCLEESIEKGFKLLKKTLDVEAYLAQRTLLVEEDDQLDNAIDRLLPVKYAVEMSNGVNSCLAYVAGKGNVEIIFGHSCFGSNSSIYDDLKPFHQSRGLIIYCSNERNGSFLDLSTARNFQVGEVGDYLRWKIFEKYSQ